MASGSRTRPRDGERKSYPPRDGERKSVRSRQRDGDRRRRTAHGSHRGGRPARGGAIVRRADPSGRDPSVRAHHDDPFIPDEITPNDLTQSARNELKTLSKENAEWVARHLAMAAQLIETDPELAHQHAVVAHPGAPAASRSSARPLAITAYATGDFALALRELRTYRRISGSDDQIALMVDSERGVGRPDRGPRGRPRGRSQHALPSRCRVELAIAMSGARLDLGETERALLELDIPELDPDRAFEWSPALFAARATVLEELGRDDEAEEWHRRAEVAAEALDAATTATSRRSSRRSRLDDVEEVESEP